MRARFAAAALAAALRVAASPDAPTFDNTIAAVELSGRALNRVSAALCY